MRPQLLAATAAAMAVASALLHVPVLVAAPPGPGTVLHLALAVACLGCAVHLWRRPEVAAWAGHVTVAALMAAHLLLAPAGARAHLHAAGGGTGTATDPAAWAPTALLLLAGLGLLLGLVRWALAADVPLGRRAAQTEVPAGGSSGRRVPHA